MAPSHVLVGNCTLSHHSGTGQSWADTSGTVAFPPAHRKQPPYPGSVVRLVSPQAVLRAPRLAESEEEEAPHVAAIQVQSVERSATPERSPPRDNNRPLATLDAGPAAAAAVAAQEGGGEASMLASGFGGTAMAPSSFPDLSLKDHGWTASFRRHSYGGPSDGDDVHESWSSASGLLTDRVVGVHDVEPPYDASKLCPGDIILRVGPDAASALRSPFPNGLESVRAEFARYKTEKVTVLVQRGREELEVQADIQPGYLYTRLKGANLEEGPESKFKVIFENALEAKEAADVRAKAQEMQRIREMVEAISTIHDAIPNPSVSDRPPKEGFEGQLACVYTILVLPSEIPPSVPYNDPTFCNFNHTMQRGLDWFNNAVTDGISLRFLSVQSEPIPGQVRRSTPGTAGKYDKLYDDSVLAGRWDSYIVEESSLAITRACRLAYAPAREVQVQLQTSEDIKSFGIVLSRSKWGFVHIMDVQHDSIAAKNGVKALLEEAQEKQKELVLLRVEGQSMAPSMLSDKDQIYACKLTAIMQTMLTFAQLQKPLWLSLGL